MDLVTEIMEYEAGEMSPRGEVELFSYLVKSGFAWTLQGSYGRAARTFIDQGILYDDGDITSYGEDLLAETEEEDQHDWDAYNDDQKLGL